MQHIIENALFCIRDATKGQRNQIASEKAYLLGGLIPHGADAQDLERRIITASSLPTSEARATARHGLAKGRLSPLDLAKIGTIPKQTQQQKQAIKAKAKAARHQERQRIEHKQRWAVSLWDKGQPIPENISYLTDTRGLARCDFGGNIRFLPLLKYIESDKLTSLWPSLIIAARPAPTATVQSCFRWYLSQDGKSKAPIAKPKLAAASFKGLGHWIGNHDSDKLIICEGIENAYSLQLMRHDSPLICAAFSSGNMSNITPPDGIKTVILAGDNDTAGQAANHKAAPKLALLGYQIKTITPPQGQDWNDLVLQSIHGGAA